MKVDHIILRVAARHLGKNLKILTWTAGDGSTKGFLNETHFITPLDEEDEN